MRRQTARKERFSSATDSERGAVVSAAGGAPSGPSRESVGKTCPLGVARGRQVGRSHYADGPAPDRTPAQSGHRLQVVLLAMDTSR